MTAVSPDTFVRRSPIYRLHAGSLWQAGENAATVNQYVGNAAPDPAGAGVLVDLSPLNRTGMRGAGAEALLGGIGLPYPSQPNQSVRHASGAIVARLGKTECWLLDDLYAPAAELKQLGTGNNTDCFPLYCQDTHAWFAITGSHLPEMMAKVCGVDLRPKVFPPGAIVQSSIARVNGIIIHQPLGDLPVFHLLADSGSAEYLWGALLDAMREFGGQAAGMSCLSTTG